MIVISQTILYFSLFATLGAALLAVLAKQWLLHYNSAGERGTIEERGLERQRKVDGMRRWGFDLVMQVFPLLLQFALLLFATALSIYLWTINHAISAITIALTGLGSILYAVMIVSAVASPDSPFQTSLSFLLKIILGQLQKFPVPVRWCQFVKSAWKLVQDALGQTRTVFSRCWGVCTGAMTQMTPLLPQVQTFKPREPMPVPVFDPPESLSKESSAVVWALETSTNPKLVEIAAEIVPELQWPPNLDVRPALKRLDDTFRSCTMERWGIREGMLSRAITCIRAFWILDMVTEDDQRTPELWTYDLGDLFTADEDLASLEFWTRRPLDFNYGAAPITPWSLRFISAQNPPEAMLKHILQFKLNETDSTDGQESSFAEFLFCLNSCFSSMVARDRSVLNKT
jgi:hypothetical protein